VYLAFIKKDVIWAGFDEALVLSANGPISEGSTENLFMIRNAVIITPPVTDSILEGINRRILMCLAREKLGIEVVESPIERTAVYICDKLFHSSTTAQMTAVA
jgi:branched-chain amino acid aminotransferase